MICSTMKATRRSIAPAETMRDESSLMIIEKEVEAKDEREQKFSERCLIIFALSCSYL